MYCLCIINMYKLLYVVTRPIMYKYIFLWVIKLNNRLTHRARMRSRAIRTRRVRKRNSQRYFNATFIYKLLNDYRGKYQNECIRSC